MVLALDYMEATKSAPAVLHARAKRYVAQGYEGLLTFESETQPGGFALWRNRQPTVFLTAYGLMQFVDMKRVHPVSPDLIARMIKFLTNHEQADGSFEPGSLAHRWGPWKKNAFYMTAYVAWALGRAGADTSKALGYLHEHRGEVEDPYGVALAALAFAAADPKSTATKRWVERLIALQSDGPNKSTWTAAAGGTFVGARGTGARIETTAMVALVLLRTELHAGLAYEALDALIARRAKDGRFGSTHSTALALRALIAASSGKDTLPATSVTIYRGEERLRNVVIPGGSTELVRVPLGTLDPAGLRFKLEATGRLRGTLSRTTYEPWSTTDLPKGSLTLQVDWSGETLAVDEVYEARVTVRNTGAQVAKVVTVEVGLPPGITVKPKEVQGEGLQEAERAERTLVLYLDNIPAGGERRLVIPFRTRYAFNVRTAPSRVYEYYVEEEQTVIAPHTLRCK